MLVQVGQHDDEQRAEQARASARQLLQDKPPADVEFARIEQSLRRAELRLRVAKRKRGNRPTIDSREN